MKKLLFLLITAFTIVACDKIGKAEGNIVVPNVAQLTQAAFADDNSGSSEVSFATTGAWNSSIELSTKSTASQWVSISPSSGDKAGPYAVKLSLKGNYTGANRAAVIKIMCNDQVIEISVTQDAKRKDGTTPDPDEEPEEPNEEVTEIKSITLPESINLNIGAKQTLHPTIEPKDAPDQQLKWSVDKEEIATVDQNGVVTGVAIGIAKVTVATVDDRVKTTCNIVVLGNILTEENFPDARFRAWINERFANSTGTLNIVDAQDIRVVEMRNKNVESLKGIEFFTNLEVLGCEGNLIADLDVSSLSKLKKLWCQRNELVTLTLGDHPDLIYLSCQENNIKKLDLGKVPLICSLFCSDNQLEELTLGDHPQLSSLDCRNNKLKSLKVSNLPRLERLECQNNEIANAFDLTASTGLTYIGCQENKIAAIDVSGLKNLFNLYCFKNKLSSLKAVGCERLYSLDVNNSELASIDLSDCFALETVVCNNNKLESLDLTSSKKLKRLDCGFNNLSSLQVASNQLTALSCHYNELISLTVSSTALSSIYCAYNQIATLNVSSPELTILDCMNNKIKTLNIASTKINNLQCSFNQLTSLDMSAQTALSWFDCSHNSLASLKLGTANTIDELDCRFNLFSTLDISANSKMEKFNAGNNPSLQKIKIWWESVSYTPSGYSKPDNALWVKEL